MTGCLNVKPDTGSSSLFGALLVYRGIFFLLPFSLAVVSLLSFEALQRRGK